MPKFYTKTILITTGIILIILLELNLLNGIILNKTAKKTGIVALTGLLTALILNEKATVREKWHWWMYLLVIAIMTLTAMLVAPL